MFKDHGMKDNVAQLLAFEPCTNSGGHGSNRSASTASSAHASHPGSSSPSGRSGRQPASLAKLNRHLRFDSGSEGEGEDGSAATAGAGSSTHSSTSATGPAAAAPSTDPASLSLNEGVAAMHLDSTRAEGAAHDEAVEEATGSARAAENLSAPAPAAASGRPPPVVVAQTHCLFNPKRGDIKLGQVGGGGGDGGSRTGGSAIGHCQGWGLGPVDDVLSASRLLRDACC